MKYNKIALIGMMGSGKTAVAKLLSLELNIPFFDCDSVFVEKYGSISSYFKNYGEDLFRKKEAEILENISKNDTFILSTGGGIVLERQNRDILFNSGIYTIYLNTGPDEIYKRIKNDTSRPLLEVSDKKNEIKKILNEREQYYLMANLNILTDNKALNVVTKEIIDFMKDK